MKLYIEKTWQTVLRDELSKPYIQKLQNFIETEYKQQTVYPEQQNIFRALNLCPVGKTKVIILGQDPYHQPGQATGLSFSVPKGTKIPPSLVNIYKEIKADVGIVLHGAGQLEPWAEQGVLLLNNTLTVRQANPGSHKGQGWEQFTNALIQKLNSNKTGLVFLLWGKDAQKKGVGIDKSKHLVLESAHPSPLSAYRGFLGNKHFSKANDYLVSKNKSAIQW